jgi:O-antigen ligase
MRERLREQLEGALQVTVVALVLAVAFVASHIQPWNLPSFRPIRTFVLFELAALALAYAVVTRARIRRLPGALVVGAFTALALLSTAWSARPELTVERGVGFAALIVAAGALALGTVGRPRVAGQLMLALLAATVLIALGGVVELWHSRDQAILPATKGQGARYNGIGQNPNQVAMLIALTLPFAVWAIRRTTGRLRPGAWFAALLLTGSLVASGSRGAVIAAFAGCLVYLLAVVQSRRVAVAALVTVAFVTAIAVTQLPQPAKVNPVLYERFGQTPELAPQDLNGGLPLESEFGFPGENVETGDTRTLFFSSGRFDAWQLALDQGLRRPVGGYGFGTEDETFVDRSYLFVSRQVENSFIGVFLQLGAVGAVLLVAALALPTVAWVRSRSALEAESRQNAAACAGAVVAGIALAVPQSYLTAVGSPPTAPFWIALFLLGALVHGRGLTEVRSA